MSYCHKLSLATILIAGLLTTQSWALKLVQGPILGDLTKTTVSIGWKTDQVCEGTVEVVNSAGNPVGDFKAIAKDSSTRYEAFLKGLKSGNRYGYSIKGQNQSGVFESARAWFTTDVPDSQSFRFVSMADSRGSVNGVNVETLSKIVSHVKKAEPALLFFQGDLINGHQNADTVRIQFDQWKQVMEPILQSVPVYMGVGSHEMAVKPIDGVDGDSIFREEFNQVPWNGPENLKGLVYSFDFGNSHFVMLDSYTRIKNFEVTEDQLEWLEKDLASTPKLHRFVGLHDVPYPNHAHLKNSINIYPEMMDKFLTLCDKYGVEIIFCGHEHNYERKLVNRTLNPKVKGWIYQVKNGTCGAPIYKGNTDTRNQMAFSESYNYALVEVDGPKVTVTAYNDNGKQLDHFSYKK